MLFTLALAFAAVRAEPDCARFVVSPSPEQGMADAALVKAASRHDAGPKSLGTTLAGLGWRIIWATPEDSEPGIFFFRGPPGAERFVDVWGGVTSDRAGAYRWASRTVGAPRALSRCFADRVVRDGP